MRPYQIVATERILHKIEIAKNAKTLGTVAAGGYVWHTTGSGKTLTSFKTAQLASRMAASTRCCSSSIARTSTTRPCASTTASRRAPPTRTPRPPCSRSSWRTRAPDHRHHDPEALDVHRGQQGPRDLRRPHRHHLRRVPPLAVRRHAHRDHQGVQALPPVRVHRHADLRRQLFTGGNPNLRRPPSRRSATSCTPTRSWTRSPTRTCCRSASTTSTPSSCRRASPTSRSRRSTPSGRCSRPSASARSSLHREHFDQKTKRSGYKHRVLQHRRGRGAAARSWKEKREAPRERLQRHLRHGLHRRREALLQLEFKEAAGTSPAQRLKVGLIFSYAANEARTTAVLDEEGFETERAGPVLARLPRRRDRRTTTPVRHELRHLADKFQNYYKDLSLRLKNRELDLVIVVNMFLTGFDATTLNTLFVDKNLRPTASSRRTRAPTAS
jgi:type I restriction enzyme R subunit